uniref:Uncharacterized protein n=1 Tax=Angiostrongylus cantonensis TaxID=6313 RepID=A0A0K0CVT5_ANGCA
MDDNYDDDDDEENEGDDNDKHIYKRHEPELVKIEECCSIRWAGNTATTSTTVITRIDSEDVTSWRRPGRHNVYCLHKKTTQTR